MDYGNAAPEIQMAKSFCHASCHRLFCVMSVGTTAETIWGATHHLWWNP